jgi:polyribonucleotide nucleotidyltransferase
VLSYDGETEPDIVAMIAASAALTISGVPFMGPIGAARVGFKDGEYQLNPSSAEVAEGRLDLVVAATDTAVMMVESEAKELTEDEMLGAVMFAHDESRKVARSSSWPKRPRRIRGNRSHRQHRGHQEEAQEPGRQGYRRRLQADQQVGPLGRAQRRPRQGEGSLSDETPQTQMVAIKTLKKLEADIVRTAILKDGKRIDGRTVTQVRPIESIVGFLPRTHGSALFTRGETQTICTTTLGTKDAEQMIDGLTACATKASCCTTTSRPIRSAKWAASAPRAAAKWATASWHGARCIRCCRRRKTSLHDPRPVGRHGVERLVLDGDRAAAALR